jgi:hypothetical protein
MKVLLSFTEDSLDRAQENELQETTIAVWLNDDKN